MDVGHIVRTNIHHCVPTLLGPAIFQTEKFGLSKLNHVTQISEMPFKVKDPFSACVSFKMKCRFDLYSGERHLDRCKPQGVHGLEADTRGNNTIYVHHSRRVVNGCRCLHVGWYIAHLRMKKHYGSWEHAFRSLRPKPTPRTPSKTIACYNTKMV